MERIKLRDSWQRGVNVPYYLTIVAASLEPLICFLPVWYIEINYLQHHILKVVMNRSWKLSD